MKILAVDSSGLVASVAVVEDDTLLGEYTVNYKKTHSQTLLPMLDEVAKMIELDLDTVDAIAVAAGPGSFTGLRIGSATAKGLGLAMDKPMIHVPTIDALACNLWGSGDLVCPLMDARRDQVYTGIYRLCDHRLEALVAQCAISIEEIIQKGNELGEPIVFLGDGVSVFSDYIEEHCEVPYSYAPAHMNRQRAGAVAWLGLQYAKAGRFETAAEHSPDYLRMSQAERERLARQNKAEES
ncbi:MAG: tRNA (adenosine(37)-N6)-threonylcarbamoyltransferase complex dimerization subunit type 1 TsaB [Lachnospiraceae bacterium]|nr:tRNA (adenosine(37)-N6)-threonylcarbamoyltransferase complex dimerization subunit type 1 TsaB [Lachnospiraceae bacterium]